MGQGTHHEGQGLGFRVLPAASKSVAPKGLGFGV